MDLNQEKELELWKRGLFFSMGASITLLGTAILYHPSKSNIYGWLFVWLFIWLAVAPLGFVLLMAKRWRQILLSSRLNTAFGYLSCAWVILLSANLVNQPYACSTFNLISAVSLITIYWYLRKKGDYKPEDMFP